MIHPEYINCINFKMYIYIFIFSLYVIITHYNIPKLFRGFFGGVFGIDIMDVDVLSKETILELDQTLSLHMIFCNWVF